MFQRFEPGPKKANALRSLINCIFNIILISAPASSSVLILTVFSEHVYMCHLLVLSSSKLLMHGHTTLKIPVLFFFYDNLLNGFGLFNCLNHVEGQNILIVIPQICERTRQIFRIIVSISSLTNDTNEIYF